MAGVTGSGVSGGGERSDAVFAASSSSSSSPSAPAGSGKVLDFVMPGTVYQTVLAGGRQDGAEPLKVEIPVSAADGAAILGVRRSGTSGVSMELHEHFYCAIRRVDGRPVEVWEDGRLQQLHIPDSMVSGRMEGGELVVEVKRKYLPVSKSHGDAPFLFVFAIRASKSSAPFLYFRSSPFFILSKETHKAPRPPPKRIRAPPKAKPFPGPPTRTDHFINSTLFDASSTPPSFSSPSSTSSALSTRDRQRAASAAAAAVRQAVLDGLAMAEAPSTPPTTTTTITPPTAASSSSSSSSFPSSHRGSESTPIGRKRVWDEMDGDGDGEREDDVVLPVVMQQHGSMAGGFSISSRRGDGEGEEGVSASASAGFTGEYVLKGLLEDDDGAVGRLSPASFADSDDEEKEEEEEEGGGGLGKEVGGAMMSSQFLSTPSASAQEMALERHGSEDYSQPFTHDEDDGGDDEPTIPHHLLSSLPSLTKFASDARSSVILL